MQSQQRHQGQGGHGQAGAADRDAAAAAAAGGAESESYISRMSMDDWLDRPFREVFDHMSLFLRNPRHYSMFAESNTCIEILLTCYCVNGGEDDICADLQQGQGQGQGQRDGTGVAVSAVSVGEAFAPALSQLVRVACMRHPNVCATLLPHFQSLPEPGLGPFIRILPAVMLVCPDYRVGALFDTLLLLSEGGGAHTLPVLALLLDMDLGRVRRQQVVRLAEGVLSSTGEADFPPLFKLIFANLGLFAGSSLVGKLRAEVGSGALLLLLLIILLILP
jgi:hypothetical protein